MKKTSELEIDEHDLLNEWKGQAELYRKWAEPLAAAKADADRKKAAMELTEAEVSAKVRENPSAFGLEKPTVDSIRGAVLMSRQYKAALAAHLAAKEEVGKLDVMVSAIEHRKKALENVVSLFSLNYFAEPAAPRRAVGAVEEDARKRVARKTGGGK